MLHQINGDLNRGDRRSKQINGDLNREDRRSKFMARSRSAADLFKKTKEEARAAAASEKQQQLLDKVSQQEQNEPKSKHEPASISKSVHNLVDSNAASRRRPLMTKSLSMIDLYGNEDPEEDKKEEEEDDTDFKDPTKNGLLLAVVKTLRQ